MKKFCVVAIVLFATACASSLGGEPETMPVPQPAADPRVSELQTQLTELLERIDVLNQRISQLEEGQSAGRASARPADPRPEERRAEARPTSEAPAEPQRALVGAQIAEDYRQAIMLFGRGRHADARRTFESVYEADPSGDLADNAIFWIGETYFAAKDYSNAVRHYQRVVSEYSTQNKAPDALFKIAMAQERTGDLALARRTLQQVIERYPYSSPASSAKAELERIKY
ncbi:MAG TPA: tol-pal system protein YbgF [Thermoanaerobaculia bacterium]|jgi:tol-pal system protein YbgF|nr:tol-pal system protein YbgF [Thermoanaerobaculia bacterium]